MPVSLAGSSSSAMHGALVPIASITGTGTTGGETLLFTNIPQTYQDLFLVVSATNTVGGGNANFVMYNFNGTSTSDRVSTYLSGNGSTVNASRAAAASSIGFLPYGAAINSTNPITFEAHILNYANTSTYKTMLSKVALDNNGSGQTVLQANVIANTAAISSFGFSSSVGGSYWTTSSRFTLYGVRTVGQ